VVRRRDGSAVVGTDQPCADHADISATIEREANLEASIAKTDRVAAELDLILHVKNSLHAVYGWLTAEQAEIARLPRRSRCLRVVALAGRPRPALPQSESSQVHARRPQKVGPGLDHLARLRGRPNGVNLGSTGATVCVWREWGSK